MHKRRFASIKKFCSNEPIVRFNDLNCFSFFRAVFSSRFPEAFLCKSWFIQKYFKRKKIYLLSIGFASVIIFLSQIIKQIKMFGFFGRKIVKKYSHNKCLVCVSLMDKSNPDLVVENKWSRLFSDFGFISCDKFKMIKVFETISLFWKE